MSLITELEQIREELVKIQKLAKQCALCEYEHPFYITCKEAYHERLEALKDEIIEGEIEQTLLEQHAESL